MFQYFRIIIAEIALTVFLGNMFIPSLVWADEISNSGSSPIVQESLPIESVEQIEPVEIVSTDTGTLVSQISDSTGETLETNTGLTDTVSSLPENTSSGVVVTHPIVSPLAEEVLTQTGSEIVTQTGVIDELPPTALELDTKVSVQREVSPEDEILVQFKTDIDTMVGQYQVDTFTSNHDMQITETISENNIVVVTPEVSPIEAVNSSFQSVDSFTADTGSGNIEMMIEQIKQDPRVEHVQKNFIYTAASYNPQNIWRNTSTGATTSTGVVTSFQIIAPSSVTVNQPFDVTIRPKDANGLTVTNYTGSIYFHSDYTGDTLPNAGHTIMFSGTNGEMSFSLGITMKAIGRNHVYIYDINNAFISGQISLQVQSNIPSPVNDPDFLQLWGLNNEGQFIGGVLSTPDADIDYPEAMNYASGKLGTGVIVAVLDTGIAYNHPEFVGHMWNGQNCLSDTGAYMGGCIHGYDFAYNDNDPEGSNGGHGTHVAGTIGAITNNDTGIVGVAPNVTLMAVKVLNDDGMGSTADIIRGINFAKHNGAKVINASLGGVRQVTKKSDFDLLSYQAIQSFSGIFVASAGNSALDVNQNLRSFPAAFGSDTVVSGEVIIDREVVVSGEEIIPALQNVISVAASDQNDNLAYFSNYGTGTVHIAAPGTNIYSLYQKYISPESIDMRSGWTKKAGSSDYTWSTRTGVILQGTGYILPTLSGEIWTDTRVPYASGEASYIERSFSNIERNMNYISMGVWCDTPTGSTDGIDVLMSTGGTYIKIDHIDEARLNTYIGYGISGNTGVILDGHQGIYTPYYYLPVYDFLGLNYNKTDSVDIRLKWVTGTDSGGENPYGCMIDSMRLQRYGPVDYEYLQGTSMAAPHVAGAAALAMSYAPNASISDIRNAILWSSDYKSQLLSKIMYGRLNVANMLKALDKPSINSTKITLSGEGGAKVIIDVSPKNGSIYKNLYLSKNPNFYGVSGVLPQIETLYQYGVISSNSESHIDAMMTRAEAAKLVANIGGYTPTSCRGNIFTDVTSSLGNACGYIESLAQSGVLTGGTSTFRPYATVTAGEFYKMLVLGLGELPDEHGGGGSEYDGYARKIGTIASAPTGYGQYYEFCTPYTNLAVSPTVGHLYAISACVLGVKDVTDSQYYVTQSDDGKIDILGLEPDTTYYYYSTAFSTLYSTGQQSDYQSFRTPKIIPQTATGGVISGTGTYYLSGSSASGVTYGTGGNQKLILADSGNTAILDLSLTGVTITASGTWDGIFVAPTVVATSTSITLVGGTTISSEVVYEIGSPTTSLTLSGKEATITIKSTKTAGTVHRVYRSDDGGNIFNDVGSCTVIGGQCSFTTNHFSQFALGNPVPPVVPPPVSPSYSISVGPGGPASISPLSISIQDLLTVSKNTILQKVEQIENSITSLQRYRVLQYLTSLRYDETLIATQSAENIIVKPISQKIQKIANRGERLLSYDFALHALETQKTKTSNAYERKVLSTAIQKISDARIKYIRQAFSE